MAYSGQRIESPATGQTAIFRRTASDTDGELLELEIQAQPGATVPSHVHRFQEERFTVVSGKFGFRIGRKNLECGPGENAVVPANMPHRFWKTGDGDGAFVAQLRPALRAEELFETIFSLGRDSKANRLGIPNPLQGAVLLDHYRDEFFYLARIPIPLQRAVAKPLAFLARRLGYQAIYPGGQPS